MEHLYNEPKWEELKKELAEECQQLTPESFDDFMWGTDKKYRRQMAIIEHFIDSEIRRHVEKVMKNWPIHLTTEGSPDSDCKCLACKYAREIRKEYGIE